MKSIFEACASSAPACEPCLRPSVRKSALLRLLPAGLLVFAALPAVAQVSPTTALGAPAVNFDIAVYHRPLDTWTDNHPRRLVFRPTGTLVAPFAVASEQRQQIAGSFFSYGTGTR